MVFWPGKELLQKGVTHGDGENKQEIPGEVGVGHRSAAKQI